MVRNNRKRKSTSDANITKQCGEKKNRNDSPIDSQEENFDKNNNRDNNKETIADDDLSSIPASGDKVKLVIQKYEILQQLEQKQALLVAKVEKASDNDKQEEEEEEKEEKKGEVGNEINQQYNNKPKVTIL